MLDSFSGKPVTAPPVIPSSQQEAVFDVQSILNGCNELITQLPKLTSNATNSANWADLRKRTRAALHELRAVSSLAGVIERNSLPLPNLPFPDDQDAER